MIKFLFTRFFSWMSFEPVVGLLMIISAIVLFLMSYKKQQSDVKFWQWFRKTIEAIGVALLFLGLLWAFRAILNDNYKTFSFNHGRISSVNYRSLKTIWGAPHRQRELTVDHYIEKEVKEEIRRNDPTLPPIYKVVKRQYRIEQNSILSSKGKVEIKLDKRKKGSAYYSGYVANFSMEYEIINDSNQETDAYFVFPLSSQALTENFSILENGKNISRELRFSRTAVRWMRKMKSNEKIVLSVSFSFRGVEYFYYQIPNPREIKNFEFKAIIHGLDRSDVNYPERCLTPKKISVSNNGDTITLLWTLDKAITTAGMGIKLPSPEQPGAKVTRVLQRSPYALMLLIVSIFLTLLILGYEVDFLKISLLAGAYCVLFILMASLSDFFLGFWGSMIIGAVLVMILTYILFKNHDSVVLKRIILILSGFFSLIYPLSGLLTDYKESFKGIVTVLLIVYLFFISLYSKIKKKA